jgi:hypothetical protein
VIPFERTEAIADGDLQHQRRLANASRMSRTVSNG